MFFFSNPTVLRKQTYLEIDGLLLGMASELLILASEVNRTGHYKKGLIFENSVTRNHLVMTVYLDKTSSNLWRNLFSFAHVMCVHMSLCVQTLVYLPGGQRSVASVFLSYYLPYWTGNSLIWLDWL